MAPTRSFIEHWFVAPSIPTANGVGLEFVVSVTGEFDYAGAYVLKNTLEASRESFDSLALHLSGVDFIDSYGIAAIAELALTLGAEGKAVTLRSASPTVLKVLRITGVDRAISSDLHLRDWRPMRSGLSPAAIPSFPHAYIRAETAREIADRNRPTSNTTLDERSSSGRYACGRR